MIDAILNEWAHSRNTIERDQVSLNDAWYALKAGLPVLSALHQLDADLRQARGPMSSTEVLTHLRPIIHLATGEAMRRAERAGYRVEIPGVRVITPDPLLEDLL